MDTNITEFRKNAYKFFNNVISTDEPLQVNTKSGEAFILSGKEFREYKAYKSFKETAYLNSIPGLVENILKEANDPDRETFEVDWQNEL